MKLVKESIEEFLNEGKYQQEVSNELPFTEQEFVNWVIDLSEEYEDDADGAYLALKRLLRMNPEMHKELGDGSGDLYKRGMDLLFKLFPHENISDETLKRFQGIESESDYSYQKKF